MGCLLQSGDWGCGTEIGEVMEEGARSKIGRNTCSWALHAGVMRDGIW